MNWIKHFLLLFTTFDFFDFLDILLLTAVIFSVYQFIKERRAGRLALGVGLLIAFLIVCEFLNLHAMQFILGNLFQSGIVLLALVFQPELRSALEKMRSAARAEAKKYSWNERLKELLTIYNEIITLKKCNNSKLDENRNYSL